MLNEKEKEEMKIEIEVGRSEGGDFMEKVEAWLWEVGCGGSRCLGDNVEKWGGMGE